MWFDPMLLVFIPGAAAMIAAMAAPVVGVGSWLWRRRAKKRNASALCGRCSSSLPESSEGPFLYAGVFICGDCADHLRRRLRIALPSVACLVVVAGVISFTGFALSGPWAGGPSLEWWIGSRLLSLLLPSAGLGLAGVLVVRAAKRQNALAQGVPTPTLSIDDEREALLTSVAEE